MATGCEDASDLGVELPGTSATSTEYRDFPVNASTILQDSLRTLKTGTYLVGRVRDNVLGTTTAKGYFNLKLSTLALPGDTIPTGVATIAGTEPNPQLDSVVIVMPFESVYGSAAKPLQVSVYPLVNALDEQGIYNSTSSVGIDMANPLGTGFSARLNGTRRIRQRNSPNSTTDTTTFRVTVPDKTVRLKLNSSGSALPKLVFDRIIDKAAVFSQARLDAVWKGLSVQAVDNFTDAVVGFPAASPSPTLVSRVIFYYRYTNNKGKANSKGTYSIPFGNLTAYGASVANTVNAARYFTEIKTEPAIPFTQLQGINGSSQSVPSGASNDLVYMQAGNGFATKLEIPGLAELKQLAQPQAGSSPAIAINRAELIAPLQPFTNLLFATPANAYLYEANATNEPLKRLLLNSRVERLVLRDGVSPLGTGLTSIDDSPVSSNGTSSKTGYYENAATTGAPFALSDVNRSYSMIMTGYVQAYVYDKLAGDTPAAFIFSPTIRNSATLGLERAVLDGKNIKLRVYYSKLR